MLELVFGVRDAVWSCVIWAAVTLMVQCRPAWSARRFVEREAHAGFAAAYAGYRLRSGEVISGEGGGAHVDPFAPPITFRRCEIAAERTSWNGDRAEFVVKYRIEIGGDASATRDVHVQLEREGRGWVYTRFVVRGAGELLNPNAGNPWKRALQPPSPQPS